MVTVHRRKDPHPLNPRVHQDLCSTEAQSGISNQQLGNEVFGPVCDVSPVLLWKLVLPLLDTLKQLALWKKISHQVKAQQLSGSNSHDSEVISLHKILLKRLLSWLLNVLL